MGPQSAGRERWALQRRSESVLSWLGTAQRQIGPMRLSDEERAMLAGEFGEPRRWAMAHQIAVGEFFDAADLVPVSQAHVMADTESLGEAGISFLEGLAGAPNGERRGPVPPPAQSPGLDVHIFKGVWAT